MKAAGHKEPTLLSLEQAHEKLCQSKSARFWAKGWQNVIETAAVRPQRVRIGKDRRANSDPDE